ncbi:MAG: hypothetical protein MZU97_15175 [Bacillus subtilis]|nr:hypothetical protein [Bacillus subtilis]
MERLAARRFEGHIDCLNFKNIDKDMADIHSILKEATTELNYQDAPSIEMISDVAKQLKPFIAKELVLIAREKDSNHPVGFTLAIPDFNQLFKNKPMADYGRCDFLLNKHKITRVRGMLQYVVPKYQGTGLLRALYAKIYEYFPTHHIDDFEAGTIMEENVQSTQAFSRFGLTIRKVYRIYGKGHPAMTLYDIINFGLLLFIPYLLIRWREKKLVEIIRSDRHRVFRGIDRLAVDLSTPNQRARRRHRYIDRRIALVRRDRDRDSLAFV